MSNHKSSLSRRDVFKEFQNFYNGVSTVLTIAAKKIPPKMSRGNLNMPLFRIQPEQGKMQERANSVLGHFYLVLLTYMIKIYKEKLIF